MKVAIKWLFISRQPAVTDGNQTEVKVRPVPRPRSKLVSKPEVTSCNDADAADAGHSSSSVVR